MTLHHEDDADGDDRFRFWPTTANQGAYRAMMAAGGPDDDQTDDPENTIQEAWQFFRGCARDYASRDGDESGEGSEDPEERLAIRYGALREAAVGMIQIVAIQLDEGEPAQVIFETLNARGTPLLASDLVKNALFERADGAGADIEKVQKELWSPGLGDIEYWSEDERLGRLTVPRSEAFLMHWLAMQLGEVIPADMLFDRFRRAFLDEPDGPSPVKLLTELRDDSLLVRSFDDLDPGSPAGRFMRTTRILDTTVFHPLVLAVLRRGLDNEELKTIFGALDSFLVRRMICRLTTKAYNRQVGELVKAVRGAEDGQVADALVGLLLESQADTARWPTDEEVRDAVRWLPMYGGIRRDRLVALLSAIEIDLRTKPMSEGITELPDSLQVEHVMPQRWQDKWPLPDDAVPEDAVRRDDHINLLGNLTLVSGPLNASMSNSNWQKKRKALEKHSMLVVNQELLKREGWDETAIEARGDQMADRLIVIWPGAQRYMPASWVGQQAEVSPENADLSGEAIFEVFERASPYLRELLVNLAGDPRQRRTYEQIEESIGWPRRRLASVLGGFRAANRELGAKRPYRIHMDGAGTWWMWLDDQAASVINDALAAEDESRAATADEIRERITDERVRELIDLIPERVASTDGLSCRMFEGAQQVVINGTDGRSVSGYFAKEWLFLWFRGHSSGDHAWFGARLSDPEQVVVNGNGVLRFHVRNEKDLDVVIDAVASRAG